MFRMKKMNISIISFLGLLFLTLNSFGQDKWVAGKIVTMNGDTVDAMICSDCSSIWHIRAIINNTKKKIEAKNLKSYSIGGETYESLSKSSGYYFFKRITYGEIAIFEQNRNYFTSNQNLSIPLTKSRFKKELLKRIKPGSELHQKIENSSTNFKNFVDVIKRHNEEFLKNAPKSIANVGRVVANFKPQIELKLNEDSVLKETNSAILKIGLDGISLEPKIFKQTSMFLNVAANLQYYKEFGKSSYSELSVTPVGMWQLRFYTNLRKRLRDGKSIQNLSGDYVAPSMVLFGEPFNFYGGGVMHGVQWFQTDAFYLGSSIGIAIGESANFSTPNTTFMILYSLRIGIAPLAYFR